MTHRPMAEAAPALHLLTLGKDVPEVTRPDERA
jgi:hypothetical protein